VLRKNAAEYNWPGHFVTFSAFERSGVREGGGDVIAYFKDDQIQYENVLPGGMNFEITVNALQLAESLQKFNTYDNIIVIPHNHNGCATTGIPVSSIPSTGWWKSTRSGATRATGSPCAGPISSIIRAPSSRTPYRWAAKMGIIASGDGHSGRAGYDNWLRVRRSHISGLVAAPSASLTRDDVWKALWNRQVFATSGKRIILEFSINGQAMGQTIKAAGSTMPRDMEITVEGTNTLRKWSL